MKKKLLSVVLIFALALFPVLSGCPQPVDGAIDLTGYKIVYPVLSNGLEKTSAEFLSDYIFEVSGIRLEVAADSAPAQSKEILIGGTSRSQSYGADGLAYGEEHVLIQKNGDKIVLRGEGLMLAGAVGQFASQNVKSGKKAEGVSESLKLTAYQTAFAKNVILGIADGLANNHIRLAKSLNEDLTFFAELLPYGGELKADSLNFPSAPDSASSATALASGVKTRNNYIGMDGNGNRLKNIREEAHDSGYKTAVVVTDAPWGATPSAFTSRNLSRYRIADLKAQQDELIAENKITYLKGTGRGPISGPITSSQLYDPGLITPGSIGDDCYEFLREGFFKIRSDKFFMVFEDDDIDNLSHRVYRPPGGTWGGDKTKEDVAEAVERFNQYAGYAIAFAMAHPGTVILIVGDHETGGLNSALNFTSQGHTNANVPVFAYGTGADIFHQQNNLHLTDVAHYMAGVMGVTLGAL